MNQGKGIEIFNNYKDIIKFIGIQPAYSYWVVQKYLEKPLLYKQRKFDIRIWAIFTSKNEVFFYNKGYLRTSSSNFSLDDENNYTHLTNNCLQQNGDDYGKHEDGNTVGFEAFQEYLDETYPEYDISVEDHLIPKMKDIVIDTFLSIKKQLNNRRENSFELLGYDFLIDEDFRVWLIEVNSNPYIGIPNDYIKNLLPKMIDDMIKLTVDPIFQPPDHEVDDTENHFDLIYSPGNTENSETSVNKRSSFELTNLYPIKELEDESITKRVQNVKENKQKRLERIKTKMKLSSSIEHENPNDDDNKKAKDMLASTQYSSFRGYGSDFAPDKTLMISKSKQRIDVSTKKQTLDISTDQPYTSKNNRSRYKIKIRSNSSTIGNPPITNKSFVTEEQKEKQKQKEMNQNLNEQVDEINKIPEFSYQRKQAEVLFDKVYARLVQSEIFTEKQTENALSALNRIFTQNLINFTDKNIPSRLAKILKASEYPENVRISIAKIFCQICRNKTMK